jgi:hypothetical protein
MQVPPDRQRSTQGGAHQWWTHQVLRTRRRKTNHQSWCMRWLLRQRRTRQRSETSCICLLLCFPFVLRLCFTHGVPRLYWSNAALGYATQAKKEAEEGRAAAQRRLYLPSVGLGARRSARPWRLGARPRALVGRRALPWYSSLSATLALVGALLALVARRALSWRSSLGALLALVGAPQVLLDIGVGGAGADKGQARVNRPVVIASPPRPTASHPQPDKASLRPSPSPGSRLGGEEVHGAVETWSLCSQKAPMTTAETPPRLCSCVAESGGFPPLAPRQTHLFKGFDIVGVRGFPAALVGAMVGALVGAFG